MALQQIDHLNEEMQTCIDNCFEATQACEWCADESVEEGEEMARCVRLCRDTADLATMHARLMARNSAYSEDIASVTADVAEECAEECAQHDMEHCQTCAEVLRACAESCRQVAA